MIIQHYLQLLRRYYRWVFLAIVGITAATAVASTLLLMASPVYTATASVAMLPTEAEYAFGRETGTGPQATMRGLTATYIEYLKSRPVIESTFDRISGETLSKKAEARAADPWIIQSIRSVRSFARRIYKTLDSGTYVASTERERALHELVKSITLRKVPDSYILRIEVGLENPQASAAVANALAEAYVERVGEQLENSAGQVEEFLREQIAMREVTLEGLIVREEALKRGLGAQSLEDEQAFVMAARETERQKLVDAQVELQTAEAELTMLTGENLAQSGRNLAELNEARAQATARVNSAQRSLALRRQSLDELEDAMNVLNAKEKPLLELARQRFTMEEELTELNTRMLSTNLARSAAMTQVRVIDPAVPPVYPSSPRVVKNTVAAGFVSLVAAFFVLIAFDTVTGSVKTTADLERLVGSRSLGGLIRKRFGRGRGKLQAGAELEQRLAMRGLFESEVVQVTGFGRSIAISEAADVLRDLVSGARSVAGQTHVKRPVPIFGGRVQLAVEDDDPPAQPASRVERLSDVTAEFSFAEAARRSPVLVCVVTAGEISESLLLEFQERSLAAGLSDVSFLIAET